MYFQVTYVPAPGSMAYTFGPFETMDEAAEAQDKLQAYKQERIAQGRDESHASVLIGLLYPPGSVQRMIDNSL